MFLLMGFTKLRDWFVFLLMGFTKLTDWFVFLLVARYNLWLMECSHDSSRCHACLFFSQSFPYKIILQLFDEKDGLRRLINAVSALDLDFLSCTETF